MQPRRRLALVLLAVLAAGCPPRASSPRACLAAVERGFAAVHAAGQRSLAACVRSGADAQPVAACLDADPLGLVGRARAVARAAEARACRPEALPVVGYASAGAAADAAVASVRAFARGLFGPSPTPAPDHRAAVCRLRVLDAANRCATRYMDGYQGCSLGALATADDDLDLAACKGADPTGATDRACGAGITSALERHCAGVDVTSLFPGCVGDVASCARGHALRSVGLALNEAHALCSDVRPGELSEPQRLQCFEPPPPEPIVMSEVPLPPGVHPTTVEWLEDGTLLIVAFTAPDVAGTQLASLHPDGSGFRCLTCAAAPSGNLRPVQRLRDGRRVLFAGSNGPTPSWRMLECTPHLLDCQSATFLPIEPPPNPDPSTPVLQYRVPWVSLDDAWFLWTEVRLRGPGGNLTAMGRLVRDADRYVVVDARVIAPPLRSLAVGSDPRAWQSLTQPWEAKYGALRGGLDQVEAGTPSAGQYDTSVIELETGRVRRLTHHPDHDEGIRFSSDEKWAVLQSARGDERVEFLGLLPRPPYIDWMAFSLHFVAIAGAPGDGLAPGGDPDERDCYVDPWLLDRWFERGDYHGQRLLRPSEGWVSIEGNAGGFDWAPEGTRIALIERRWRGASPPGQTRLRLATLANREPIAHHDVVPIVATPEPTWALRYEDWIVPDTLGVTVVPGEASGTATIRNAMPTVLRGEVEVVYDDYSDDGRRVLDGFERIRIPSVLLQGAEYEVDLSLRGEHAGSMRGSLTYDFVNDVNTGEVVSELDGRVLRGPRTCYEAGLIPTP